jgi:uncharacterized protein (TIGR02145 family)
MKKIIIFSFILALFFFENLNAQVPQGIPYQAIARNGQGQPLANTNVKVRFSILDSTATGTAVYVESHSTTTSTLGLFTANVGMGTVSTGTFNAINWGQNYKFLKVELDTTATGNSYIDLGTQQMMSVPYSKYAENTNLKVSETGDTLRVGNNNFLIIPGISEANGEGEYGVDSLACGAHGILNPSKKYGTVTDIDGNVYRTIVIGKQKLMAENLKVSHYNNGDLIPNIIDDTLWSNLDYGAYCWNLNDSSINECVYGKLYNWYAVNDNRLMCPVGWHIPSNDELFQLLNFLGPGNSIKLRTENIWWYVPLSVGDNNSGFSSLPGLARNENGSYSYGFYPDPDTPVVLMRDVAFFWSHSDVNIDLASCLFFSSYSNSVSDMYSYSKKFGMSVRCIKN